MAKSVHKIHREIPTSNRIEFPDIPEMDEETEFPEKNFQVSCIYYAPIGTMH